MWAPMTDININIFFQLSTHHQLSLEIGIQYFIKHVFFFCEVTDARKGSLQKFLKLPKIDIFYLNFIVHPNDNFLCFLLTLLILLHFHFHFPSILPTTSFHRPWCHCIVYNVHVVLRKDICVCVHINLYIHRVLLNILYVESVGIRDMYYCWHFSDLNTH